MPFDTDTSMDLEDYHVPCAELQAQAHAFACRFAAASPQAHTDQGYRLWGGRFWVNDHRARKWQRHPGVTVTIRIDGREGVATAVSF